jgi:hypothetical protein
MRLAMRVLVLLALPGLVFSWVPAAVGSVFLPECGEVRLLSLFTRPSPGCSLSAFDTALIGCGLAALTIVMLLVVRVVAPSFTSFRSARNS